jgi:succinate dehydrogenase / fumarate reductase cytochrome b subunit
MSSLVPSKRERPTNALPSGKGLLDWLKPIFASSVGGKFLTALTGLALTGFVIVHMLGNLQIFLGPDAINEYAKKLKDLGALLWVARIGLLAVFLLHIALSLRLQWRSKAARPVPYSFKNTVQATIASRTMVLSGLVIFLFVVFHIAHYTLGVVQTVGEGPEYATNTVWYTNGYPRDINLPELKDEKGRHDVYRMMILGFSNPGLAILYIVAQLVLMLHLSHGVASTFQTLGLNTPRLNTTWRCLGWTIALVVGIGNIAIVLAVWTGLLPLVFV